MHLVVEFCEFGGGACLAWRDLLRFAEVLQVAVVCPDVEFRAVAKEVSPVLKTCHHRAQLLVVDLVVAFGVVERLAEEAEGSRFAVDDLVEDATDCVVGGVGLETETRAWYWKK